MNMEAFKFRNSLLVAGIVAALGVSACDKGAPGQMSDQAAAEAPKESATLGEAVNDAGITAKVKQRIATDARTKESRVEVQTSNGVVTLSGSAPNAEAKVAAEELARNVEEVQGIDNRINAPSALDDMSAKAGEMADRAGENATDAVITTKVKAKLAQDDQVKARAIDVDTNDGVVALKGEVPTLAAKQRAVELAANTEGVKKVEDDQLRVSGRS